MYNDVSPNYINKTKVIIKKSVEDSLFDKVVNIGKKVWTGAKKFLGIE